MDYKELLKETFTYNKTIKAKISEKMTSLFLEKTREVKSVERSYIKDNRNLSFFELEEKLTFFPILIVDKKTNIINIINRKGDVIWSYGEAKFETLKRIENAFLTTSGSVIIIADDIVRDIEIKTKHKLFEARYHTKNVTKTKDNHYLISDLKNNCVFEVDNFNIARNTFVDEKKAPFHSERLDNGNTIVCYTKASSLSEFDKYGKLIWTYGKKSTSSNDENALNNPEYFLRLANGNTFICDTQNSRIINVSKAGKILQRLQDPIDEVIFYPSFIQQLKNGNIFIKYVNDKKMIELDLKNKVLWKLHIS
ncbi:MAG: hypothetical protein AABZ74_15525 [Cyanobacteriota bacterium]